RAPLYPRRSGDLRDLAARHLRDRRHCDLSWQAKADSVGLRRGRARRARDLSASASGSGAAFRVLDDKGRAGQLTPRSLPAEALPRLRVRRISPPILPHFSATVELLTQRSGNLKPPVEDPRNQQVARQLKGLLAADLLQKQPSVPRLPNH